MTQGPNLQGLSHQAREAKSWPFEQARLLLDRITRLRLNDDLLRGLDLSDDQVREVLERETVELHRRERAYRAGRVPLELTGRTVVLVDDGIATGASMVAAVHSVRQAGAARVVVAVPVGPATVCRTLRAEADDVVCATTPADFHAVGQVYDDFHQVDDDEVRGILDGPTVSDESG